MPPTTRVVLAVLALVCSSCRKHDDAAVPADHAPAPASADVKPPEGPAPPALEAAIAQAAALHKPLVLEFYTGWCHPCQTFAKTTLVDKRVQAALGEIMFVRYDAEAEPGSKAGARYHINSFPTFLTLDKRGEVVRRSEGVATDEAAVQRFLSLIADAKIASLDEADVRARVAAAPNDATVRLDAGRWFAERGNATDAIVQLDAVLVAKTATRDQRAEASATGRQLRRFARWKQELVAEKLAMVHEAPGTVGDRDLAIATVDSGATPAELHDAFTKVFAAQTDPAALNSLLYVALAAGAKDEALAAAKQASVATKDPNVLDTIAECFHVHGDRTEALRVEDQAIALSGPTPSEGLIANRARFATGQGDASEVTELRASVARMWKQLRRVDAAPSPMDADGGAAQSGAMAMFSATQGLGAKLAAACAGSAGSALAAFARVTLDPSGKVTSSSVFTTADAPAALRTCLTAQLASATLPVVPGMTAPPIEISFVPGR